MLRIIIAVASAAALFIVGWSQLISLKHRNKNEPSYRVIDFEPQCNETTYLDMGSSEEIIIVKADPDTCTHEHDDEHVAFNAEDDFLTIDDGQTLHSILRPKKVSELEIAGLSLALKPHLLAKDLAAGDFYRFNLIEIDNATSLIDTFVIRKLDPNRLPILYKAHRINRQVNDAKFTIEVREPKIIEEVAVIKLTVAQTLYATFNNLPFGNEVMQRLMGIFAWELPMPQEVLQGDEIELVVIKKFALGNFIGFGKILSVNYQQKNRSLFATFFTSKDEKIRGFFNEHGKSMEREFAYSPVYETTATSNQMWRMHPIRKIRIRHNGIDYRGTIGTEFFSIADGEIVEKRYDQNVGNMMRIKHKYGVHSEYFHADSLVSNLKVGDHVKRGQKIGTIGRTGRLCTGPHLHMGLYRLQGDKRKFIELSSLKNVLKPAPHVDAAHINEFNQHVKTMMAKMGEKPKEQLATVSD